MRNKYNEQLEQLNNEMVVLGSLCENAIASAAKSLIDGDMALTRQVTELSQQIEQKERDIVSMCLKILLQQQPVATAVATIKMVTDSIDAFVNQDMETAMTVIRYDDVVDNCFDAVKGKLIELFSKPETDGEYAIDLLMIAKYFERIGDHAVNIAHWVLFSITGKLD